MLAVVHWSDDSVICSFVKFLVECNEILIWFQTGGQNLLPEQDETVVGGEDSRIFNIFNAIVETTFHSPAVRIC